MSHQHPEAVEEAMMTEVGMTRTKTRMCTNPREGDRHGKEIQALKDMPEETQENIASPSESSVTGGDNLPEAGNMGAVNDRSLGQQPALAGLPNVEKMSAVISSRVVTSVRRLLRRKATTNHQGRR